MNGELIAVSFISGVFMIISILLINHNWFKRKEMEHNYNIKRFKLGKKYKLKEQQLPQKTQKGLIESLKGVDSKTISAILDALQGEEIEDTDDISSLLQSPIVQNIIKGIGQGGKKEEETGGFEG